MDAPEGYWIDARGNLVPEANVRPIDRLEDELVRDLAAHAEMLNEELRQFREMLFEKVEGFRGLVLQDYGVTKGGRKGNLTLSTFDGSLKLTVAVSEHIGFGAELQAAKALIDACITRWSEGANANIRALVDQAFQVNKEGRIDTQRVLALRRLDMGGDAEWKRAMDAIGDALRVTGSRTYARFHRRDPKTERDTLIALDLANA